MCSVTWATLFCLVLAHLDVILGDSKPTTGNDRLPGAFSITTKIEHYDASNKQFKTSLTVTESYSEDERRSMIQVEESGKNVDDRYYYDANSGVWLHWSPMSARCGTSSQLELNQRLYGDFNGLTDDLFAIQDEQMRHIVGSAKFLLILQKFKSELITTGKFPEKRSLYGRTVISFRFGSSIVLEVLYDQAHIAQLSAVNTLPLQLVLFNEEHLIISMSFAQFKRLDDDLILYMNFVNGIKLQAPLLFPLSKACEKFVGEQELGSTSNQPKQEMLRKFASEAKITFTANLIDNLKGSEHYFRFAFDSKKKLARKDRFLLDEKQLRKRSTLTTIYDINQGKKFNFLQRHSQSKPEQPDLNHTDQEVSAGCVTSDMSYDGKISNYLKRISQYPFIEFERFRFMGYANLGTRKALVYKLEDPDMLPFWLFPTVLVNRANSQPKEISELQMINGEKDVISSVYYFSLKEPPKLMHMKHEPSLGQLLRIDILVTDSARGLPLLSKTLEVVDFVPSAQGFDTFSLNADCPSLDSIFAQFNAVMEPQQADNTQKFPMNLYYASEFLESNVDRDEIILDSLFASFQLSPIYIEHFKTQLLLEFNKQLFPKRQPSLALPRIKLTLKVSDLTSAFQPAECTLLGRGSFYNRGQVFGIQVSEFEECFWFAHHHSLKLGREVLFAYDQRKSLCLLDHLYREQPSHYPSSSLIYNYFPYEYADFDMYKLTYRAPNSARSTNLVDSRALLPIVGNKALHLVGFTLNLVVPHLEYQIPYKLEHVKMSGELPKADGSLPLSKRIDNLSWIPTDGLVKRKIVADESIQDGVDLTGVSNITESICHSACLLDLACWSYSFCRGSLGKQAECLMSKVNINQERIQQQLQSYSLASKSLRSRKSERMQLIELGSINGGEQTSKSTQAAIRIDNRCYMSSKSYLSQFEIASQHVIDSNDQSITRFEVTNKDECAEHCFQKNIRLMMDRRKFKLDLDRLRGDLRFAECFDDQGTMLETILDWFPKRAKSLCTRFHYSTQKGEQEQPTCFISESNTITEATNPFDNVHNKRQVIEADTYKLVFTNLFERSEGFRLANIEEIISNSTKNLDDDAKLGNDRLIMLKSYLDGLNEQLKLGIDDVEHCARACTMQLSGPRPSCGSFDMVLDRSTGQRYCLLNSQNLHSLRRRRQFSRQVVYGNQTRGQQFWHFEPREHQAGNEEDDYEMQLDDLLGKTLAKFDAESTVNFASAFIFIMIVIFAMASGLTASVALTGLWFRRRKRANRVDSISKHRMTRLVHTLRKVSLKTRYENDEVRM